MDYKIDDTITINNVEYTLGEKILFDASNLKIGESYIEHTQINPDRFDIWEKDFDTETIENSWKIKSIKYLH